MASGGAPALPNYPETNASGECMISASDLAALKAKIAVPGIDMVAVEGYVVPPDVLAQVDQIPFAGGVLFRRKGCSPGSLGFVKPDAKGLIPAGINEKGMVMCVDTEKEKAKIAAHFKEQEARLDAERLVEAKKNAEEIKRLMAEKKAQTAALAKTE